MPVVEWEEAFHRVVLDPSLMADLGIRKPVMRWARAKRREVLRSHADSQRQIDNIEQHLFASWWAGREPIEEGAYNVLFLDDRWYIAVFGDDRNGSLNMVTLHSLRPRQLHRLLDTDWMRKREK